MNRFIRYYDELHVIAMLAHCYVSVIGLVLFVTELVQFIILLIYRTRYKCITYCVISRVLVCISIQTIHLHSKQATPPVQIAMSILYKLLV